MVFIDRYLRSSMLDMVSHLNVLRSYKKIWYCSLLRSFVRGRLRFLLGGLPLRRGHVFENRLFNVRYVFKIPQPPHGTLCSKGYHKGISINRFHFQSQTQSTLMSLMEDIVPPARVQLYVRRYEHHDNWRLWIAYVEDRPAGCLWALCIPRDDFCFGSIVYDTSQILVGGANVRERFRGMGLSGLMLEEVMHYIVKEWPERTAIAIVERTNTSSLRVFQKYGVEIFGMNYLIKFLGKNVLSILVRDNGKKQVWPLWRYK